MLNLQFDNIALSLASQQDMPLSEMLQNSSIPLATAIMPSEEAKLLYCVVLKGKRTELILHMNKQMSNITHYEQHDVYERGFDVFYGNLTVRSQFVQLESELRRNGKAEGRMILYDRKNKPFHAVLKLQPIIIQNDYEELIIAYYLIEMKRLNDEVPTTEHITMRPRPVAMSVEDSSSDDSETLKKTVSKTDSAKTSSQSLLSSSPSDNDDECSSSSKSRRAMSNSDATSNCDEQTRRRVYTRTTRYDSDQIHPTNKNQSMMKMEIVAEEERLLTKNALKRHDERSLHEMNNSKRSKFMASK